MSENDLNKDYLEKRQIKPLLHNLLRHVTLHKPLNVYDFIGNIEGEDPKAPPSPASLRNTLETGNINESDIYTDKVLKVNQYRIGNFLVKVLLRKCMREKWMDC